VVRFWGWFYKSEIIERLAEATGFSVFPRAVRQTLLRKLESDIMCGGGPVFANAPEATFTLESVGVPWLEAPMRLHSGIYSNVRHAIRLLSGSTYTHTHNHIYIHTPL